MNNDKWYNQATVQAAIVSAIPNIIVAFVAIVAMISTCHISNKQIKQNEKLAIDRYSKDSILVELQLQLAKKELELNNEQFVYSKQKSKLDSINAERELSIINKQLKLAEMSKSLDELAEKSNLQKLNGKIIDKLNEFFEDNDPKTIKPGESITYKFVSDLMLDYNVQNKWAKELKEMFYLGLTNKYLMSNKNAFDLWKKSLGTTNLIISMTDDFIKGNFFFKDNFDFKFHFNEIWESHFDAYRILFSNTN